MNTELQNQAYAYSPNHELFNKVKLALEAEKPKQTQSVWCQFLKGDKPYGSLLLLGFENNKFYNKFGELFGTRPDFWAPQDALHDADSFSLLQVDLYRFIRTWQDLSVRQILVKIRNEFSDVPPSDIQKVLKSFMDKSS